MKHQSAILPHPREVLAAVCSAASLRTFRTPGSLDHAPFRTRPKLPFWVVCLWAEALAIGVGALSRIGRRFSRVLSSEPVPAASVIPPSLLGNGIEQRPAVLCRSLRRATRQRYVVLASPLPSSRQLHRRLRYPQRVGATSATAITGRGTLHQDATTPTPSRCALQAVTLQATRRRVALHSRIGITRRRRRFRAARGGPRLRTRSGLLAYLYPATRSSAACSRLIGSRTTFSSRRQI